MLSLCSLKEELFCHYLVFAKYNNMSHFAAATTCRPTPELIRQLFIKLEVTTAQSTLQE